MIVIGPLPGELTNPARGTLGHQALHGNRAINGPSVSAFATILEKTMSDFPAVNPYSGPGDGKPLDEKLTKDEIEAFYQALRDRDRAIVLSAIAENHLTSLLQLLMRRNEKDISRQLFNPTGPLGPFGTKIRVAYMLRILPPEIHKDLMIVSKIRNKFAHDLSIKSFDDQQITDWVKSMYHYKIFLGSVKTFREKTERESKLQESEHKFRTIAYVLGNSAETIAGSYRETVRLIIHWIVDYERHIKSEEERLNSWRGDAPAASQPEKP
jgi:DNA-binding MltR family transcriptional regulator